MKKLKLSIALLLSVVLLCFAAVSAKAEIVYIRGDADRDGSISISDVTVIQRKLVDLPVPAFYERAADVDANGLDITDATKIQRKLADFNDHFRIGETVRFDEYELPVV